VGNIKTIATHPVGTAIMHLGSLPQYVCLSLSISSLFSPFYSLIPSLPPSLQITPFSGANALMSGERFNLIMWFKRADKFIYFNSIPPYLKQTILSHLSSPRDILNFGSCCKQSRELSNQDYVWETLCQSYFRKKLTVEALGDSPKHIFQLKYLSNSMCEIGRIITN
jgi:F-box-like